MLRRDFLKSSGMLVASVAAIPLDGVEAFLEQGASGAGPYPDRDFHQLDSWIVIRPDNTATFYVGKTDLGQGTGTAFRQIMADELDIAFEKTTCVMGVTDITVAILISPFLATARSSPAPTARMVACGGLMTAAKSLMPNMPRLETAAVPPWYSSGLSLRPLARAPRSFISLEIAESVFSSARRTMGVMRPPGMETATPTSACLC